MKRMIFAVIAASITAAAPTTALATADNFYVSYKGDKPIRAINYRYYDGGATEVGQLVTFCDGT